MLFCCSYCGVRVLVSGVLFGTNFDLPVDLKNGVFGEDHSKHIMDASKNHVCRFFSREVLFFFQPQAISIFCVAALEVGTLVFAVAWWRWYEKWSNPPCCDDVGFFNSRRRGAKNAIGFQRKVVSSANWNKLLIGFERTGTDWDISWKYLGV